MADTIFTNQTPAVANANDGQPITTATTFIVTAERATSHHRFYAPTTVTGPFTGQLWHLTSDDPATGDLIATATYGAVNSADWNQQAWDGGNVDLELNEAYRTATFNAAGHYVATADVFDAGGITNGDLTAIQQGSDPVGLGTLRDGAFRYGAISLVTPPSDDAGGGNFFADLVLAGTDVASEGVGYLGLSGAGAGVKEVTSVGVGQLGLSGAGAGVKQAPSAGVGWLGLSGVGAGVKQALSAGVGWLGLRGVVAAVKAAASAGAGWLGLSGAIVRPPVDLAFTVGTLGPKWFFGPLTTSTGGRGDPLNQSVLSTAYVQTSVQASVGGTPYDPTSDSVAFAFVPPGTRPVSDDWQAGSWDTNPAGTPLAQCLVGPADGVELARGLYGVWLRITDNPEVPIAPVGTLQIN